MLREDVPWSNGVARLVAARLAQVRGRAEEAAKLFETAAQELDAADMALHATVARRPARFAAMISPGVASS